MIIFDFDQTLVDTSSVEHLRERRAWKDVMAQASRLPVYKGINELLGELHRAGHKLAIVTKSPDMVPRAFIREHGWPIDIVVGYHNVKKRKPDPEALFLAMQKAGAVAADTFHVGDHPDDTEASRRAGVTAIGSAWGLTDAETLVASQPDQLFDTVAKLKTFFVKSGVL